MYARRVGEQEVTFDFAEGLLQNNLLFVDRETSSIWSQLHSQAISGPLEGTPLQVVASMQTTWEFWRRLHPDTRVVLVEGEEGRPYFYRNRTPGTRPPEKRSTTHDTSVLGLGLVVGGEAIYFPFRELERASTPLTLKLGGKQVTINYRQSALTAWAEDAQGNLLPGVLAYEQGWRDFNPGSETYRAATASR